LALGWAILGVNRETNQVRIQAWIQVGAHVPHVPEASEVLHASFNLVKEWNIGLGASVSFPDSISHQGALLTLSNEAGELKLLLLRGEP
jgi:hypothetical protein